MPVKAQSLRRVELGLLGKALGMAAVTAGAYVLGLTFEVVPQGRGLYAAGLSFALLAAVLLTGTLWRLLRGAGLPALAVGGMIAGVLAGCSFVLGNFSPYLLGLGERTIAGYQADADWEWHAALVMLLALYGSLGGFAGLVCAVAAWLLPGPGARGGR